ncbi:MAG: outer membrane lipoprotein carrier protein LolA [Bacteroidales bacterium]|nr:outer membrane lipoprotein carrier protein LolA [Bacteroidales bacterium]
MKKRNIIEYFGGFLSTGIFFFICINFIQISTVGAQSYTPVKDVAGFKELFTAKSTAINTLKSDFVQEKSICMLNNKLTSNGSFVFKKANKLRMEYANPYPYVFVMNDDQILIKNDQKMSNVSVNSNKIFKMISQLTIDCVTGNILNSKDFDVNISENAKVYLLVLMPNQKMIKSLFSEIDLLVAKSDFTVDRIDLKETSGDGTTLIFSNKKINSPVSDEAFSVN